MSVELKDVLRFHDPAGRTCYMGVFRPSQIKQLTFVPVVTQTQADGMDAEALLNEDDESGYQRAGDYRRMSKIKDFVVERPNCLLPPVVLSARGGWKFTPRGGGAGTNVGTLTVEKLAAIIDGQHRLGGMWQVFREGEAAGIASDKVIPFLVVDSMPLEDERREFVDINDNQKGVKKSLLTYLEKDKSFWGQAAYALAEDEESVFKGRIDIQKKHDWTIFLFRAASECVESLFGQSLRTTKGFDPASNLELREPAIEYTLKYWRLVSEAMPELWADMEKMPKPNEKKSAEHPGSSKFEFRLLEETGIRAMSQLGCKLFASTWIDAMRAPAWDAVEAYLRRLNEREKVRLALTKPHLDPRVEAMNPHLKSTGKAGVGAIMTHLETELLQVLQG